MNKRNRDSTEVLTPYNRIVGYYGRNYQYHYTRNIYYFNMGMRRRYENLKQIGFGWDTLVRREGKWLWITIGNTKNIGSTRLRKYGKANCCFPTGVVSMTRTAFRITSWSGTAGITLSARKTRNSPQKNLDDEYYVLTLAAIQRMTLQSSIRQLCISQKDSAHLGWWTRGWI
jgi:hypothetical protein